MVVCVPGMEPRASWDSQALTVANGGDWSNTRPSFSLAVFQALHILPCPSHYKNTGLKGDY